MCLLECGRYSNRKTRVISPAIPYDLCTFAERACERGQKVWSRKQDTRIYLLLFIAAPQLVCIINWVLINFTSLCYTQIQIVCKRIKIRGIIFCLMLLDDFDVSNIGIGPLSNLSDRSDRSP